ncbi:response regulator transcription factor [Streptomyces sp. NPDC002790]|uniref:helix-turn-helix transcriptional regulator n=1 Tax=Streptomyces sp. NPDC002790 TaxID=3154431 RepID=UPI00332D2881
MIIALLIDSEALSSGLELLLAEAHDVSTIAPPASESLEFLAQANEIDLLIISADQWQELAPSIGTDDERPKILVIGDDLHTRDTKLMGTLPVDGFLGIADLSQDRMQDTIERVIAGQMPMPPQLARHLLVSPRLLVADSEGRMVVLTPRERETLSYLVQGMSNKQVARALGISVHGAKRLVATILLKLGASNRTAAVVTAMKSGLV